MKSLVNVQTQIDKVVKDQAVKRAEETGFNSLQDVIRLFIYDFARGDVKPRFDSVQQQEGYNEWVAQIRADASDIERRTENNDPTLEKQTAHSVEELIQKLESDDD